MTGGVDETEWRWQCSKAGIEIEAAKHEKRSAYAEKYAKGIFSMFANDGDLRPLIEKEKCRQSNKDDKL